MQKNSCSSAAESTDAKERCPEFKPDHAAMVYALFARNARSIAGEKGHQAVLDGLMLYADQRGKRMRRRAMEHGDPLTMTNYMLYCEWKALPGTSQTQEVQAEPVMVNHVHKCPWYDIWAEKGFLDEGEDYCRSIDSCLVKAFNPELQLDVTRLRIDGDPYCEFRWNGCSMDEENRAYLAARRAELKDSCIKDWVYHTRHVFSAMKEKISALAQAEEIVSKTMADFEAMYGAAARACVEDCADIDFYQA